MSVFSGSDFRVQSVVPIGLATLRVRYTQDPKLTSGFDGSLRVANYVLTGPAENYPTNASEVVDDPQAVDLYLAAPIELGTWTLAVSNVVDENDAVLEAPTSLTFNVERVAVQETVPAGAVNDDIINVLRKHFNPALKGPNWDSLLAALAAGDVTNWNNAKLAFNQLFVATASGAYLDKRASDQGVRRPPAIAMPDDLFRDLVIVSKTSKLTQDAILEMLEVFYGPDAVRATITTKYSEMWNLEDGDDLILFIDERDIVTISFSRKAFARMGTVTAVEVATSITQQLRNAGFTAFAVPYVDDTGAYHVRIYSGRLGISSSIRVIGGRAQPQLLFTSGSSAPDYVFEDGGGPPYATWNIAPSPDVLGNYRYTLVGTSPTFTDLNEVVEGDIVMVYGTEFLLANRGSFDVVRVGVEYPGPVQWFEIAFAGTAQTSVAQLTYESLMFHRAPKRTIYNESRHALVSQTEGHVEVILPATTQAVARTSRTAAYGNLAPIGAPLVIQLAGGEERAYSPELGHYTSLFTTPGQDNSLRPGDVVLVENIFPNADDLPAANDRLETFPAFAAGLGGSTAAAQVTISDQLPFVGRAFHYVERLDSGLAFVTPGAVYTSSIAADMNPVVARANSFATLTEGGRSINYAFETLTGFTYTIRPQNFGFVRVNEKFIYTGGHLGIELTPTNSFDVVEFQDAPRVYAGVSGTMPVARAGHASFFWGDKVTVCGGWSTWGTALSTGHYLDPDTLAWTAAPAMVFPRMEHQVATLTSGVLAVGGHVPFVDSVDARNVHYWNCDSIVGGVLVDSVGSLSLTVSGGGTTPVGLKNGCWLPGGSGLATAASNTSLQTLFRTNAWTIEFFMSDGVGEICSLGVNAASPTNTLFRLKRVAGGTFTIENNLADGTLNVFAGVKDISTAVNTASAGSAYPSFFHVAVTCQVVALADAVRQYDIWINGKLFETIKCNVAPVAGTSATFRFGTFAGKLEEFRIVNEALSESDIRLRYWNGRGHTLRDVPTISFMGNQAYSVGHALETCELWNGTAWTQAGSMAYGRVGFAHVVLPNDQVLVMGGIGYKATSFAPDAVPLASCELYDAALKSWRPIDPMPEARYSHSAAYVAARNEVWVFGGDAATPAAALVLDLPTLKWRYVKGAGNVLLSMARSKSVVFGPADQGFLLTAGGISNVSGGATTPVRTYLTTPGTDVIWTGGLNGVHVTIDTVSSDRFAFRTPGYAASSTDFVSWQTNNNQPAVRLFKASRSEELEWAPGPFTFDPKQGIAITGVSGRTAARLRAGHQYIALDLDASVDAAPADAFPDLPGWLVFAFGESKQVWPVRYMGRISSTQLALDAAFVFPVDLDAGVDVTLVDGRKPFAPTRTNQAAGFYATASSAGRVAAGIALDDIVAAGLTVKKIVVYPGDRGLGGEGNPTSGSYKISDIVRVFGGDDVAAEVKKNQAG